MWQLLLVNVPEGECILLACFPPVCLHVQYTAVSESANFFFPFYTGNQPLAHVSALLHALVAIHPPISPFCSLGQAGACEDEVALPVTAYVCQWKRLKKRKESTMKMSEATFEKHTLCTDVRKGENFLHLKILILAHRSIKVQPHFFDA